MAGEALSNPLSSSPHDLGAVHSFSPASYQGDGETRETGKGAGARAQMGSVYCCCQQIQWAAEGRASAAVKQLLH